MGDKSSGKIFKNDRFLKSRGGHARFLTLLCEKCKNPICLYQKDGPGILKRLYLDRISDLKCEPGRELVCGKCKTLLGVKIIYKKENRPAFRLFAGSISKKTIKSSGRF